jgi:glycosyltransferase involved in cell wall biosynthesis
VQQAVEKLAADPALATRLGESGRRYVVEHFDRNDQAARLIALLETVTRPRMAGRRP